MPNNEPQLTQLNPLPHLYEIEDMLLFCRKYEHIFIYGMAEKQELLLKFFDNCHIQIDGYVVSKPNSRELTYRDLPIFLVDEVIHRENIGIIVALSDKYYGSIIPYFREMHFTHYFLMTEHNKYAIANQMKKRAREETLIEVNLADHCNLSCQMCDHYSQLADEKFLDIHDYERDMQRMAELLENKVRAITLLGGEPTLHKDLIKFMEVTRRYFPQTSIALLTNGILLPKLEHSEYGNVWQACKDYKVHITVTVYPLNFDYVQLEKKAKEYGVVLLTSSNIHADEPTNVVKTSDKHTFNLDKKAEKSLFVSCLYFNKFNVLKGGRYYPCPVAAHIGLFNKYFNKDLTLTDEDSVDIYKVKGWEELSDLSSNCIPFCQYCDIGKWHADSPWKPSSKDISEYV